MIFPFGGRFSGNARFACCLPYEDFSKNYSLSSAYNGIPCRRVQFERNCHILNENNQIPYKRPNSIKKKSNSIKKNQFSSGTTCFDEKTLIFEGKTLNSEQEQLLSYKQN